MRFCSLLLVIASSATVALAGEHDFQLKCRDGFVLDGKYALPANTAKGDAKRVIILLHGSGPQSMDEDLTAATRERKKNLFFKELSDALSTAGFTVVRYHKRAYQVRLKIEKDADYVKSKQFQSFSKNWLKLFIEDAHDCLKWAAGMFPKAKLYYLGHSQGTYIGLQVANFEKRVAGVAMIGFYATTLDTISFAQIVYRPVHLFRGLDKNGDDQLDEKELGTGDLIAASLKAQLGVIDLDKDKKLSLIEFQAGNFSNLGLRDALADYRKQEASYPRVFEILKDAKFKVAFFHGLLDNQTPAYQAKAIEMLDRQVWKKNFKYKYFRGLGHALDKRSSYTDVTYGLLDADAKKTLVKTLGELFE